MGKVVTTQSGWTSSNVKSQFETRYHNVVTTKSGWENVVTTNSSGWGVAINDANSCTTSWETRNNKNGSWGNDDVTAFQEPSSFANMPNDVAMYFLEFLPVKSLIKFRNMGKASKK